MNMANESMNLIALRARYEAFKARGLRLDMSRGKPEAAQLDLSEPMMAPLGDYISEDGQDTRNYGDPTGIPEAKRLFGALLGVPAAQVIVGGNSSINLIHDALSRAVIHGPLEGDAPWGKLNGAKILCPVPGYDWHFNMCRTLGLETVPIPTGETGPDMDVIESLARDPSVKGMICVPMYGNPSGVTYSDETVDRLAAMQTAAPDFRIFWDNAYCVHHLYPDEARRDHLKNLYEACAAAGHENRVLMFTSTSKITFAGGGVSAMAASPKNIARQAALMTYQLVCYDKVNQLRHARFLPDLAAVEAHMAKHAAIIRPKFEYVLGVMDRELSDIASWSRPRGGYFICFRAPRGCAKRVVQLCAEAGVTLTPAGSPFPDAYDPADSVIRIAPTYPPMDELRQVMELFPLAVKIAALERG
ncbi:MAG: aminotransferase class I/II-fold pyridoxal phosphate-dependent enzyme [Clostridia bacterium]|nr:aminotransferase class I/II-fold pyridoxal phosphate-dependent enzyme [Clostridia bacterium]